MSAVVVDANVALKWVVTEEGSEAAAELASQELIAPAILLGECANALWAKVRRRELSAGEALERLAALQTVPVELVSLDSFAGEALGLALQLEHPVYDCLYLALALQRDLLLITADGRFTDVVRRHGEYSDHVRRLSEVASS